MKLLAIAFVGLFLASCNSPGRSLAGYEGLHTKVAWHYRNHGVEENGTCRMPEIRAITRTEVVEDTEEKLTLRLRYRYLDTFFQNERRPIIIANCEGFNSREFFMAKVDGQLKVTGMSGDTR